ncbi:MAG: hypothetical protein GY715_01300 [Planctomycetes bacterium]|nr:hypothetical protein [Planctomycetota bacterium]
MKRLSLCAAGAVLLAFATSSARAQSEPSAVEAALDRLERALDTEEALAPETKQALRDLTEALRAERRDAHAERARGFPVSEGSPPPESAAEVRSIPVPEDVPSRLRVYGDLRLREEFSFNLDDQKDRNRFRIRARLRADYQLNDDVRIAGGIRTGARDDPNSPYVTIGDGFKDFELDLDLALVDWRPKAADGWWLTAGKFINPVRRNPVYGELVWDYDVNPEGVVTGYRFDGATPGDWLDVLLGGWVVLEDARTDDAYLLATQVTGHLGLSENLSATATVGYYLYGDPAPDGNRRLFVHNAGNRLVDTTGDGSADAFLSDFGILNPMLSFTWDDGGMPFTISAEYIYNTQAREGRDRGYAIGASLGRQKKKGDWRFYYQWQEVEQDAVFSAFSQDDFVLQTNFRGHVYGGAYKFTDDIGLHLWALVASRISQGNTPTTDSDEDQWRLRADLTFSF